MYVRSAALYDLMHPTLDYELAAASLVRLINERSPSASTLLDVGCGTGRHLALLNDRFKVEGVDINEAMLDMARSRCPTAPLHCGDMRSFRLGRQFDVVTCLFSSIGYVESFDDLVQTVQNLRRHAAPGGFVVIEPWLSPERYRVGELTTHMAESPDISIAWMYSAEIADGRSIFNIHHLVGSPNGVEHFVECHSLALFTTTQYRQAFRASGLTPEFDESGFFGYGMFIASVPK